jgi:hypothetical protein
MVAHFCNPSTWDAKARGSQVQVQPELHSKMLLQKKNNNKYNPMFCQSSGSWISQQLDSE